MTKVGKVEEPVSVSTNEVMLTIAAIPFVPTESASHVKHLAFMSEDGDTVYHRKTKSVDVERDRGVKLRTTEGDMIKWSVDEGNELTITTKDGKSWGACVYCTECTATNLHSTP